MGFKIFKPGAIIPLPKYYVKMFTPFFMPRAMFYIRGIQGITNAT